MRTNIQGDAAVPLLSICDTYFTSRHIECLRRGPTKLKLEALGIQIAAPSTESTWAVANSVLMLKRSFIGQNPSEAVSIARIQGFSVDKFTLRPKMEDNMLTVPHPALMSPRSTITIARSGYNDRHVRFDLRTFM